MEYILKNDKSLSISLTQGMGKYLKILQMREMGSLLFLYLDLLYPPRVGKGLREEASLCRMLLLLSLLVLLAPFKSHCAEPSNFFLRKIYSSLCKSSWACLYFVNSSERLWWMVEVDFVMLLSTPSQEGRRYKTSELMGKKVDVPILV